MRVLGLLYPTLTLVVIVATANHFVLDAEDRLCWSTWPVSGPTSARAPR